MVNTSNWDKFSKRVMLGLVVSALVAAFFLLLGIYICLLYTSDAADE